MREREALGRDHTAEVDLVADDDVGPILGTQREDAVRPNPRDAVGETVAQNQILPFRADLEQRQWLQEQIEQATPKPDQKHILTQLIRADLFEQVIQQRYLGTKQDLVHAPNDGIKLKVAV